MVLLSVMLSLAPAVSHGEEESPAFKGAFSIVWQNDLFSGNDNNFTNGVSLNLTSAEVGELGSKISTRRPLVPSPFCPRSATTDTRIT
jgi:hypothetical protein